MCVNCKGLDSDCHILERACSKFMLPVKKTGAENRPFWLLTCCLRGGSPLAALVPGQALAAPAAGRPLVRLVAARARGALALAAAKGGPPSRGRRGAPAGSGRLHVRNERLLRPGDLALLPAGHQGGEVGHEAQAPRLGGCHGRGGCWRGGQGCSQARLPGGRGRRQGGLVQGPLRLPGPRARVRSCNTPAEAPSSAQESLIVH